MPSKEVKLTFQGEPAMAEALATMFYFALKNGKVKVVFPKLGRFASAEDADIALAGFFEKGGTIQLCVGRKTRVR